MSTCARTLVWAHLGAFPYRPAEALQARLRAGLRAGEQPEHLLTLEHRPPVFTLGRNATPADITSAEAWRAARGIEVHTSDRGGKVTYHGPGQLVAYPILNLDPDRRDIRRYVRDLERVIIRTLAEVGIAACVREGREFVGVWTGGEGDWRKIASIGVHLSHWITTHGFALNVNSEMGHFDGIVACGLQQVTMTSIARELGHAPPLRALAAHCVRRAAEVFDRRLVTADQTAVEALRQLGLSTSSGQRGSGEPGQP